MSEDLNGGMDFVRSAIDDILPAGIECECKQGNGGIVVVLTNPSMGTSFEFTIGSEWTDAKDSDAFAAWVRPKIVEARESLYGKQPKRRKPAKKKAKKAKRKAKSVKMRDATPELQRQVDEALEPLK